MTSLKEPKHCNTLEEVREQIDTIDKEIISLFAKRFEYVKEVVKYKNADIESIIAAKRRDEVLEKRKEWAQEKGLDPEIIGKIYSLLIEYFIQKELELVNLKQI